MFLLSFKKTYKKEIYNLWGKAYNRPGFFAKIYLTFYRLKY